MSGVHMAAEFLFLMAACRAMGFASIAAPAPNPLPVLRGIIGSKSKARPTATGFQPINPINNPGLILQKNGLKVRTLAPVAAAKPAQSGFGAAINKLFTDPQPKTTTAEPIPDSPQPIEPKPTVPSEVKPAEPEVKPIVAADPKPIEPKQTDPKMEEAVIARAEIKIAPLKPGEMVEAVLPEPKPSAKPITLTNAKPTEKPKTTVLPKLPESSKVQPQPKTKPVPEPVKGVTVVPEPKVEDPYMGIVTCEVTNQTAAKIIQTLAKQAKVNLVILGQPERMLSVNLAKISYQDALKIICSLSGLKSIKVGQTCIVATPDELEKAYPAECAEAFGKEAAKTGS